MFYPCVPQSFVSENNTEVPFLTRLPTPFTQSPSLSIPALAVDSEMRKCYTVAVERSVEPAPRVGMGWG